MATLLFQCPECGFGAFEVGHLGDVTELHCVVCLEERGRQILLHCWEEHELVEDAQEPHPPR